MDERENNMVQGTNQNFFKFEVIKPDSRFMNDSFRLLAEAFVDEPASVNLQCDPALRMKGWTQFVSHFGDECSTNGLSVACIDQESDQVAAAVICRDFCAPLPPLFEELIGSWKDPDFSKKCDYTFLGPLLEVLMDADKKYVTNKFPDGLEFGTVVDFWMAGTDKYYRKKGLMARTLTKAADLAREKGFKYGIGECTGAFSSRSFHSLGAIPVAVTEYADFKVSDGRVGLDVELPHTKLEICEMDLKKPRLLSLVSGVQRTKAALSQVNHDVDLK